MRKVLLLLALFLISRAQAIPVNITQCGSITSAGDYLLNTSLTGLSSTCLTVSAADVHISCADGVSLTGDDSTFGTRGITSTWVNTKIENCSIASFNNDIWTSNSGVVIQGNIISGAFTSSGVAIQASGSSATIKNNVIAGTRNSIQSTGGNSIIGNNYISLGNTAGVALGGNSVVVENNTVSSTSNSASCYVYAAGMTNLVSRNNSGISCAGGGFDYSNGGYDVILIDGDSAISSTGFGFDMLDITNLAMSNVNITDATTDGIIIEGDTVNNLTFENVNISQSASTAFKFFVGSNIVLDHIQISGSYSNAGLVVLMPDSLLISNSNLIGNSISLDSSANVTLLNGSYSSDLLTINPGSLFNVDWYFDAQVNDSGIGLQGVDVSILDNSGLQIGSKATDSSGLAGFEINEYYLDGTNQVNFTPHNVTISKTGYADNSTNQTINSSMLWQVNLVSLTTPTPTPNLPPSGGGYIPIGSPTEAISSQVPTVLIVGGGTQESGFPFFLFVILAFGASFWLLFDGNDDERRN